MPHRRLRSKPTHLFQPLTVGFTVGAAGEITDNDAPRKFLAGKNEIVTWIVGNNSGRKTTVSLLRFLRKNDPLDEVGDSTKEVRPFKWIGSNVVVLEIGQTGIIAGKVDPEYDRLFDFLSYTIRVEGFGEAIDYDPDGDIKP
jgi:hypothetical protein